MDLLDHVVVGAADLRPDTRWVARRALKPDPHAGACAGVPEQPGGGTILAHAKIDSPVMIEVGDGCPALLPIHAHAAFRRGQGAETSIAVTAQP